MVIKTVQMQIPILISRSGFTAWGVELARQADLTLIGRAKGKRFIALAGERRIVFDADPHYVADEGPPPAAQSQSRGRRRCKTMAKPFSAAECICGSGVSMPRLAPFWAPRFTGFASRPPAEVAQRRLSANG